jgi:hypothetical protein
MNGWTLGARACEQCGEWLPKSARADARFCSDGCRAKAHRSRRMFLAQDLLDRLADDYWQQQMNDANIPGRHAALAASMFAAAAAGSDERHNLAGGHWMGRVEQVRRRWPFLMDEFGEATVIAAAMPLPRAGCRWCAATRHSSMHDQPPPRVDAATSRLLGARCPVCAGTTPTPPAQWESALAASAAIKRAAKDPYAKARPVGTLGHRRDECVICAVAELAFAECQQRGYGTLEQAKRRDPELANMAERRTQPHARSAGMTPTQLYRAGGHWHLRFSTRGV